MNPALEPISALLTQGIALNEQIQTLLAANMADVQTLQGQFVQFQQAVAKTDTMLGALAASLAAPKAS